MRTLHRPRAALVLTLIALACTGGTFTCNGSNGDDDGEKVTVDTSVKN